jgi:hypothetical protein
MAAVKGDGSSRRQAVVLDAARGASSHHLLLLGSLPLSTRLLRLLCHCRHRCPMSRLACASSTRTMGRRPPSVMAYAAGQVTRPPGFLNAVTLRLLVHVLDQILNRQFLVDTGASFSIFPHHLPSSPTGPLLAGPSGSFFPSWGRRNSHFPSVAAFSRGHCCWSISNFLFLALTFSAITDLWWTQQRTSSSQLMVPLLHHIPCQWCPRLSLSGFTGLFSFMHFCTSLNSAGISGGFRHFCPFAHSPASVADAVKEPLGSAAAALSAGNPPPSPNPADTDPSIPSLSG